MCALFHLAASVFAFLYALVDIFKGYFEEDFDEDSLRDNFTLVYELLDGKFLVIVVVDLSTCSFIPRPPLICAEVLDYGYPQNCSLDVLKMYINLGSQRAPTSAQEDRKMTSTITGARDWRREGIVHKKNEVFLDVLESVNLLLSTTGTVLRNDVTGQVCVKKLRLYDHAFLG